MKKAQIHTPSNPPDRIAISAVPRHRSEALWPIRIGVALLVAIVAVPLRVAAADQPAPAVNRQPLHLQVDPRPIDRNAPDRISYAPIIEKTAASVVFVYSTKQVRAPEAEQYMQDPMLRQFFGSGGDQLPPETEHGLGSGIVISDDGYILTNNHVVDQADEVKVSIGESMRRYNAKVVGTDALSDVAVLKIEADGLVPAILGDSDKLKIGDVVLAIGDPFGIGQSVSRGIVSAVGRGNLGIEAVEDFIQTDAAINPGNSGGALIDSAGRVVGLNTAILSRTGGFAGVGFAIPINLVRGVAEQIVNRGHVERGYLGVVPQRLTPALADQFGTWSGALLADVVPNGPAARAGLQPGDVVTQLNGAQIRDAGNLLLSVSQLPPGSTVNLEYLRGGQRRNATVQLGRRPQENLAGTQGEQRQQPGTHRGVLNGVAVADLTPQIRDELQVPPTVQGAVVTAVDPTSAAAAQGLRPGDLILGLDQKPVRSAEECVQLSEQIKGPKVVLRIWREGHSVFEVIDESGG